MITQPSKIKICASDILGHTACLHKQMYGLTFNYLTKSKMVEKPADDQFGSSACVGVLLQPVETTESQTNGALSFLWSIVKLV